MAVTSREIGGSAFGRGQVPGNKVGAGIIWIVGCVMTYAAIDQATPWPAGWVLVAAVALQVVLTVGQSPVWAGRGSLISFTLLALDTIINFGGTMAIFANLDDVGSVQALTATFGGFSGEWPMWIKGCVALFFAAVVAGLPEFLWKLD